MSDIQVLKDLVAQQIREAAEAQKRNDEAQKRHDDMMAEFRKSYNLQVCEDIGMNEAKMDPQLV